MLGLVSLIVLQRSVILPDRAMRLDAMARELTRSTGVVHRVTGTMAARVVLVAGPSQPIANVRADLAAATWGTWRQVGGEWRLDEDTEGILSRDRTRMGLRLASVERALASLQAKPLNPFDAARARALRSSLESIDRKAKDDQGRADWAKISQGMHAVESEMPGARALRGVLASFPASTLAALPDGRVVFSDRPNRLQRALPPAASGAIRQLEREQTTWAEAIPEDPSWAENRGGVLTSDPRNYGDSLAPNSVRLVLVLNVDRNSIGAQAWFVDDTLRVRQFAERSLEVSSSPLRTSAPVTMVGEKPLELGEQAKAYALALQGKASPELRQKLLRPETYEPLDFFPAEIGRAIARERKVAFTAWLDDNFVAFAAGYHNQDPKRGNTASEWIRQMWVRGFNPQIRPGAIVLRPRGAATNVDRTNLGTLLRAVDRAGGPRLDDLADYASASPPSESGLSMLAELSMEGLLPGASALARSDWQTLRLWGMFPRAQRQAFVSGATIPIRNLRPDQRNRIVDSILRADRHEVQAGASSERSFLSLEDEPTERLAGGFDLGAALTVTRSEAVSVLATGNPAQPWTTRTLDPWELAYFTTNRERNPGMTDDGYPVEVPSAFVPGRMVTFGFTLPISPTMTWTKSGQQPEFDLRGSAKPLSALPPEFQKAYEENLKGLRSSPSNSSPVSG